VIFAATKYLISRNVCEARQLLFARSALRSRLRRVTINAVYPTKKNIYTEKQKIGLQELRHLAFRGRTSKSYSPVAVYPTEKKFNTEKQKNAPRELGHLGFRGCTSKNYSPVAV